MERPAPPSPRPPIARRAVGPASCVAAILGVALSACDGSPLDPGPIERDPSLSLVDAGAVAGSEGIAVSAQLRLPGSDEIRIARLSTDGPIEVGAYTVLTLDAAETARLYGAFAGAGSSIELVIRGTLDGNVLTAGLVEFSSFARESDQHTGRATSPASTTILTWVRDSRYQPGWINYQRLSPAGRLGFYGNGPADVASTVWNLRLFGLDKSRAQAELAQALGLGNGVRVDARAEQGRLLLYFWADYSTFELHPSGSYESSVDGHVQRMPR